MPRLRSPGTRRNASRAMPPIRHRNRRYRRPRLDRRLPPEIGPPPGRPRHPVPSIRLGAASSVTCRGSGCSPLIPSRRITSSASVIQPRRKVELRRPTEDGSHAGTRSITEFRGRMGHLDRRAWVLAGAAILGFGTLLVAVRVRAHSDPAELAAETRLALRDRRWSRAEDLLARLARCRPPTVDDVVLRAELELGRGRRDRAIGLLTGIPESDPHAARARLVAGQIEKSRDRARGMEALLRGALRLDPKLTAARRELIFLYGMQARRADLSAQYRALAAIEPLNHVDVLLWTTSLEDIWINET